MINKRLILVVNKWLSKEIVHHSHDFTWNFWLADIFPWIILAAWFQWHGDMAPVFTLNWNCTPKVSTQPSIYELYMSSICLHSLYKCGWPFPRLDEGVELFSSASIRSHSKKGLPARSSWGRKPTLRQVGLCSVVSPPSCFEIQF